MESRTVYIYGLWDPRDGRLRYIGKTVDLKARLRRHCIDYDKGKITHCSTWVKGVLNDDLKPTIEILEECTEETWREAERDWIAKGRELGLALVNMVDGGRGGHVRGQRLSDATKEKIRAKLKGRPSPTKGKSLSEETKLKSSLAHKGKRPRLGMKNTPEQNAKIGAANAIALKGTKLSESRKAKVKKKVLLRWQREGEKEQARQRVLNRSRNNKGQFLPKQEGEGE